jgi:hypothetical protein
MKKRHYVCVSSQGYVAPAVLVEETEHYSVFRLANGDVVTVKHEFISDDGYFYAANAEFEYSE